MPVRLLSSPRPIDLHTGQEACPYLGLLPLVAGGEMRRLTEDAARDASPSIAADGNKVVFVSNRSGNAGLWIKDLESGREMALTPSPAGKFYPVITPDGLKVAYGVLENQKEAIYVIGSGGG